jgi:hypothetical protein
LEGTASLKGTGIHVHNVKWAECAIRLTAGLTVSAGEAKDAVVVVGTGGTRAILGNYTFNRCVIGSPTNRAVVTSPDVAPTMLFTVENLRLEDCVFGWPCIHEDDLWAAFERQQFVRCSGPILVRRPTSPTPRKSAGRRSLEAGKHLWVESLCLIAADAHPSATPAQREQRLHMIDRELQRLGAGRLGRLSLLDRDVL